MAKSVVIFAKSAKIPPLSSTSYFGVRPIKGGIMNNARESEIIKAEEKLRMAMVSSDVGVLDELLSPSLIFTNHLGQVISKSDDLEGHKQRDLVIENLKLSEQQIKLVGELAIVTVLAIISGSYKGSPANGNFRFTRVWANENGAWQVVAGHSSIVA